MPIYEIPHSKLIDFGLKTLLLDVDGTILDKNSSKIPNNVKDWINKSKIFFKVSLVSNNSSKKRISKIANELGLNYKYNACKPFKKKTNEIMSKCNDNNENIAIIGDRILTDIIVGNRCNIKTILVNRINKKGLPIKRDLTIFIEKIISFFIFI